MADAPPYHDGRPSRPVAIAVAAVLVAVWGYVRLVAFSATVFPIAYILPLFIGVWTRDRQVLWAMAGAFATFHTLKMFWILPEWVLSDASRWATWGSTLTNIMVGAAAVHLIINLRERLEGALREVQAQAEELQAQGEELAQQNEELTRQTEELAQQGEELASQNEELQTQSEEISQLNQALERREALLHALLETARLSGPERAALDQIAAAARDLFPGGLEAVAVYEAVEGGLRLRGRAAPASAAPGDDERLVEDGFVSLVLREQRTASLHDAGLRPDLVLGAQPASSSARAVLCAPIRVGGEPFGAFALYATAPREWTEEDFRLAEWLADQCARVLQTLRVQSDLREADRRKSEFLATLSHELRNPLAAIGFALNLIESGRDPDAKAIAVTRRQLQQLVRLVDDLLDATRLSSNKVQIRKGRTDVAEVVQHALDAARPDIERAGHRLELRLPPGPVWLDADADRLAQLVTNLLQNASRYTPSGGQITVSVSVSASEVVLSVADTGVGMDREDLDRVFEMFTQLAGPGSGGLGIGLALVRGIAELHGGRAEARSDGPGRGSEFRITLPLAPAAHHAAPAPAGDEAAAVRGQACRVLIVDDNVDAVEMMAALLEMHGHEVRVAHDAESALAAARDFSPEAAVLDIGLPGTDGYELARRFRQDERTRHVRLVALTGWGQDGDRARARDAGFDAHLTKPAEPELILAALRSGEPA
jgi:signal transduction histidine kinase/ActR/RegA family two-component response regulator